MNKNSSEYIYLATLSETFDELVSMLNDFTPEQSKKLLPMLNKINEILNMDIESLNNQTLNWYKTMNLFEKEMTKWIILKRSLS